MVHYVSRQLTGVQSRPLTYSGGSEPFQLFVLLTVSARAIRQERVCRKLWWKAVLHEP